MTKSFSIKETFNFSREQLKRHFWFFVAIAAIFLFVSGFSEIFKKTDENGELIMTLPYALSSIITWFLGILISIGILKICLDIVYAKSEKPKIKELFSHTELFIKYLLSSLLYGLIVSLPIIVITLLYLLLGLFSPSTFILVLRILLAIIGLAALIYMIIYSIRLGYYKYYIVEGTGVVESIKNSHKITKKLVWQIFVFYIVLALVNLLGAIVFFVGLLVTIPLTYIASTYVYRKLKEAGQDFSVNKEIKEEDLATQTQEIK